MSANHRRIQTGWALVVSVDWRQETHHDQLRVPLGIVKSKIKDLVSWTRLLPKSTGLAQALDSRSNQKLRKTQHSKGIALIGASRERVAHSMGFFSAGK
jgi:hypothetical protein